LPDSVPHGSVKMHVIKVNSDKFDIPSAIVSQMEKILITFRNVYPEDLRHFPDTPAGYGLTVTEPEDGNVRISFANPNPSRWNLHEGVHAYVVVVNIKNAEGKRLNKIVKNFEYENLRLGESNEFVFSIDKQYYDYSSCSVIFYTKQPNNDDFIRKFFIEGGGTTYKGMWTSTGGELWRLPLEE
jgi:hypothetical protein